MIKFIGEKYQIMRRLAQTNDSEVYLGRDLTEEDATLVAIKVFRFNQDNNMVEMYFKRECDALSLLRHENIVNILDQGYDKKNELFYIVLEYIEGKTLESIIKEKLLKAYDKESIIKQIFDAINYAHSQNILHRDIKPGNIMITSEGKVKLIDFGISKIIDSLKTDGDNFTIQSLTYKYASPEQKLNKSLTFQSDIFSLGLVCFELLKEDVFDINVSIKKQILRCNAIPNNKKEILLKMTEESTDERFTNIYNVIKRWNDCKTKKQESYSISLSNNAINKLYELGMIDSNNRNLATAFVLDDLNNDIYIASCKVAYNDIKSKNYILWGNQIEYTCVLDIKSKNSFIVISISVPETFVLEMKKDNYGMIVDKKIYIDANKEKRVDINKLITLYNEKQKAIENSKEKNNRSEELIKKWTSVLEIQKEICQNNKNTLRYSRLSYNTKDGRVYLKIKNNIEDVEFTQDQMLVVTLKNSKGFKTAKIGHFSDFKDGNLSIDIIRGIDIEIFAKSGEVSIDTGFMDNIISKQESALKKVKNKECACRNLPHILSHPEDARINYTLKELSFKNELLDENKKDIIEQALCSKDIYLLQGPPGTGKTTVISELVIQQLKLNPNAKILVSSQSNVAVNHAMNKIKQENSEIKVVRLGRDEMISNGMENYTIDAQAEDVTNAIKRKVELYFEHIKNRNFDRELFDKYNLALEVIEISQKIEKLQKEIYYDKEFRDKKYTTYLEKKEIIKRMENLKESFNNISLMSENNLIDSFIYDYIKLGEDFIKNYEVIIKLEKELEVIDELIINKESQLISEENNLVSGFEILEVKNIKEIIEYKKEVEVKLEKQKKKLEQFSKYEKIKNEWLKKITQSEEIEKILMEQVSVIGATCIGIANYTSNFDLKFDLVIVDEAGRATPPEILVPMVLGKKIILVGDHKQLPPVIDKMLADEIKVRENYNKRDLEESLFSYLEKNLNSDCRNILKQQYRMNPVIGDLISSVFYNDKIISMVSVEDRNHQYKKLNGKAIVWIDTKNDLDKTEETIGTTKQNSFEARNIIKLLIELEENYSTLNIYKEVAVITGYKAQKNLIARLIEMENIVFKNIKIEIDTVDAFQGRETDIVIYSIVRSNSKGEIGFLSDQRRLNVSLSRARELLVLIGDSDCVTKGKENAFSKVYNYINENPRCKVEVI